MKYNRLMTVQRFSVSVSSESLFNFIPSISVLRLYFAYTYRSSLRFFSVRFKPFQKAARVPLKVKLCNICSPIQSFYLCYAVTSVVVNWIYLRSFFQVFFLQMVVLFIWMVYVSCVHVGELVGNFLTTVRKSGGITDLT